MAVGPSVTVLPPALPGRDRFLGGELGADGCIYGIPGSAGYVVKVDPATGSVTAPYGARLHGTGVPFPAIGKLSSSKKNQFKWLRGVLGLDGCIYGVPSNGNAVLRINPAVSEVSLVALPSDLPELPWKWHGGVLAPDGCVYGIPCNAPRVLKIDTRNGQVTMVGPVLEGKQKWYGGLLGCDGCIYGIPFCASAVLRIVVETQEVQLLGEGLPFLRPGGFKWHGGAAGSDGVIYGMPSHASTVLRIDPRGGSVVVDVLDTRVGDEGLDHKGFVARGEAGERIEQGKYKYGGAVVGRDGCVYGLPSDAERVMRIACDGSGRLDLIGPVLAGKNKWQNGMLGRDGAVYAIPCDADGVLQIKTGGPGEDLDDVAVEVNVIGGPFEGDVAGGSGGHEKWEGGVEGPDGALYCMPQEATCVLKIDPGPVGSAWATTGSTKSL